VPLKLNPAGGVGPVLLVVTVVVPGEVKLVKDTLVVVLGAVVVLPVELASVFGYFATNIFSKPGPPLPKLVW